MASRSEHSNFFRRALERATSGGVDLDFHKNTNHTIEHQSSVQQESYNRIGKQLQRRGRHNHPTTNTFPASANYQGDITNPANRSARIPMSSNCSIWITGLPVDCTIKQLLASIRSAGKIFACHINPPNAQYKTTAAKITFWDREGTNRFPDQYTRGAFRVRGNQPAVRMNRVRGRAQSTGPQSRVLRLVGPGRVVNGLYLEDLFRRYFFYGLDEIIEVEYDRGKRSRCMEIRFGSYRAQSSAAMKWIKCVQEGNKSAVQYMSPGEKFWWAQVEVSWGEDPCAGP
ncbi:hypothetical protein F4677DRAFT_443848 [Hypoxylon crocopeplum]|nr:hypothetical protein F4677DRAFT_443848 [Hypoxylon crocopeplum]